MDIAQKLKAQYNYINHLEGAGIISTANKLGCKILTTEKDYYRIKNYNLENIKYIKTKLEISDEKNLFKIISSS